MHSEKLSQEAGWFVNTHDLVDRRPDEQPDEPPGLPDRKRGPPLLLVGGVGLLMSFTLLGVFVAFVWTVYAG